MNFKLNNERDWYIFDGQMTSNNNSKQKKNMTTAKADILVKPKIKLAERDCPRCHAVLVQNKKEECYECPNCGYIDCGDA